jgi:hypothetical protein
MKRTPPTRRLAAAVTTAAVALLVVACGSSGPSPSGVATLPSASAGPAAAASAAPSPNASDLAAQGLAYANCIRSNGVPGWPDPDASGAFDKSLVRRAVGELGSPTYQQYLTASTACQDLLPANMREPTAAEVQQQWTDDRNFAQCMRSLGVVNAPDPVADGNGRPYFNLAGTGIDTKSPDILAKAQKCATQLHMSTLPHAAGGGS